MLTIPTLNESTQTQAHRINYMKYVHANAEYYTILHRAVMSAKNLVRELERHNLGKVLRQNKKRGEYRGLAWNENKQNWHVCYYTKFARSSAGRHWITAHYDSVIAAIAYDIFVFTARKHFVVHPEYNVCDGSRLDEFEACLLDACMKFAGV